MFYCKWQMKYSEDKREANTYCKYKWKKKDAQKKKCLKENEKRNKKVNGKET